VRVQQEQAWESEGQEAIQDGIKLTGQEKQPGVPFFSQVRNNTNRFCVLFEGTTHEVASASVIFRHGVKRLAFSELNTKVGSVSGWRAALLLCAGLKRSVGGGFEAGESRPALSGYSDGMRLGTV
jgi:hypothetical protein